MSAARNTGHEASSPKLAGTRGDPPLLHDGKAAKTIEQTRLTPRLAATITNHESAMDHAKHNAARLDALALGDLRRLALRPLRLLPELLLRRPAWPDVSRP